MATVPQSHTDPFSVRNSSLAVAELASASRQMLAALKVIDLDERLSLLLGMVDPMAQQQVRKAIAAAEAAGLGA